LFVSARAESEKVARVAQNLWLCCIALNGVIRYGNEKDVSVWEDRLAPLKKQVDAISDAGGKHPFVETMLMNIPGCAVDRGVWTEDALKERFSKVNKICRRVAMVDDYGSTLFKYFLSYVQSFFIVNSISAKSENDVIDMDKLDTFTILGQAEYWLEKGNLELALRFMNQLAGASRRVASDWVKEATLLLETRQAAQALTAFASASGLGTIF
jgi:mitofilin